MEEIKINDYIRFDDGTIIKAIEEEVDYYNYILKQKEFKRNGKDTSIVKYSSNIIDLIELGDYVNGWEVQEKFKDNEERWYIGECCGDSYYDNYAYNDEITTIVTKEQFKAIEYKVGE